MPAQWTGDLLGEMHVKDISVSQLAEELGVTKQYVSMVLHGHRSPPDAEERFRAAVERLSAGLIDFRP